MTLRISVFPVGDGGLRHERPQPRIFGNRREMLELLFGDRQFVSQLLELLARLSQPLFNAMAGHRRSLCREPGPAGRASPLTAGKILINQHRGLLGAEFSTQA